MKLGWSFFQRLRGGTRGRQDRPWLGFSGRQAGPLSLASARALPLASGAPRPTVSYEAGLSKRYSPPLQRVSSPTFGIHPIRAEMDRSFEEEAARLEHRAVEEAQQWARAGLPRQGTPVEGPLPVETDLVRQCREIYQHWLSRIRARIGDEVHDASRQIDSYLWQYRTYLAQLRRALLDAEEARREGARLRRELKDSETTFGYGSFLSAPLYFGLLAMLVIVDWIANVPIFTELVPQEPGADEAWREFAAQSERYGLLAGPYRVLARVLFSPDVSLLAAGVIVFLIFLGHVLGGSVRRLVALREEDEPTARLGIRVHRRQFPVPIVMSAAGIALVITVLFLARGQVERVTQDRLRTAAAEVGKLEEMLARARGVRDLEAVTRIEAQLPEARLVLDERRKRAAYAAGIAAMNLPILLLNTVLVLAAAVAAYLAKKETVRDRRVTDPEYLSVQEELARLREEEREHRRALRETGTQVQLWMAQLAHLVEARPLRGWEAKEERLQRVIPLFRSVNARERGIDPANVAAFQNPVPLDLAPVDAEAPLVSPATLQRYEEEFGQLRAEFLQLDRARPGPEAAP